MTISEDFFSKYAGKIKTLKTIQPFIKKYPRKKK